MQLFTKMKRATAGRRNIFYSQCSLNSLLKKVYLSVGKSQETPVIRKLPVIFDKESKLLCCACKLKVAETGGTPKCPVLIPRHHRAPFFITEQAYRLSMHYGINYLITILNIRTGYQECISQSGDWEEMDGKPNLSH